MSIQFQHVVLFDFVSTMATEFIQTHASLKSITPQGNLPVKSH